MKYRIDRQLRKELLNVTKEETPYVDFSGCITINWEDRITGIIREMDIQINGYLTSEHTNAIVIPKQFVGRAKKKGEDTVLHLQFPVNDYVSSDICKAMAFNLGVLYGL